MLSSFALSRAARITLCSAGLLAVLVGCGTDPGAPVADGKASGVPVNHTDPPATTVLTVPPSSTPTPTPPTATVTVTGPRALQDGVYLVGITRVSNDPRRLTVDVMEFAPGQCPELGAGVDGCILNRSKGLRTYPVAPGAPITTNVSSELITGQSTIDMPRTWSELPSVLDDHEMGGTTWQITLKSHVITKIAENYMP